MRLFIIGANGDTGTQLIDLALARSHQITAFVRSPEKITRQHPALTLVKGDPRSADELAAALPGHDAVFSALGARGRDNFRPNTLLQDCMASTVAAMTRADVRRIGLVSAATLFDHRGLSFTFFRWFLQHQIRDLTAAETILRATPLDWTIARPPRLVHSRDESYRKERDALPPGGSSVSFRAVAAFLLDAIERHEHLREIVGVVR